jgi:hypothetical protein
VAFWSPIGVQNGRPQQKPRRYAAAESAI